MSFNNLYPNNLSSPNINNLNSNNSNPNLDLPNKLNLGLDNIKITKVLVNVALLVMENCEFNLVINNHIILDLFNNHLINITRCRCPMLV